MAIRHHYLLFLAAGLTGCAGATQGLGRNFVIGIRREQPKLDSLATEVVLAMVRGVDSATPRLQSSLRRLDAQLDSILDGALDSVEHRALRMQDSLGVFLSADARAGLRDLVTEARTGLRTAIRDWGADLKLTIRSELAPELRKTVALAVDTASLRLARAMDSNGTVGTSLDGLAQRLVHTIVEQIKLEDRKNPTPGWVIWLAIGGGLVVLSLLIRAAIAVYQAFRQRDRSLRLVTQAIQETGDKQVAGRVKSLARQQGAEGWLHDYLERNRLLVDEQGGP